MLTVGGAGGGSVPQVSPHLKEGLIQSRLLEAAWAVEDSVDKDITLSGELVVEVREHVHGGLDLTIRPREMRCRDVDEVRSAGSDSSANHPASEGMPSDALAVLSAGSKFGSSDMTEACAAG